MVSMYHADRRIDEQSHPGFAQAATKIYFLAELRRSQSPKLLVKTPYTAHSFGRHTHDAADEVLNLDQPWSLTQDSPAIFMGIVAE